MSATAWDHGSLLRAGRPPEVIFGFQHEDAAVETSCLARTTGARALCVASGGETAFALLGAGASEVVAIDVNPAQLRLIELKSEALRLRRGDYLVSDARALLESAKLSKETAAFWTKNCHTLRRGLCFTGTVERRTIALGPVLRWFSKRPEGARAKIGWRLLRIAINLGYARRFRRRLPGDWSQQLASRVSAHLLTRSNSPLWLAELGLGFGVGGLPLYSPDSIAEISDRMDHLFLVNTNISDFLQKDADKRWDLIALSNLGDTMDGREREALYSLAADRLREGGILVVRSIVHSCDSLPDLPKIQWQSIPAQSSPVCPVIGIGRLWSE